MTGKRKFSELENRMNNSYRYRLLWQMQTLFWNNGKDCRLAINMKGNDWRAVKGSWLEAYCEQAEIEHPYCADDNCHRRNDPNIIIKGAHIYIIDKDNPGKPRYGYVVPLCQYCSDPHNTRFFELRKIYIMKVKKCDFDI